MHTFQLGIYMCFWFLNAIYIILFNLVLLLLTNHTSTVYRGASGVLRAKLGLSGTRQDISNTIPQRDL